MKKARLKIDEIFVYFIGFQYIKVTKIFSQKVVADSAFRG